MDENGTAYASLLACQLKVRCLSRLFDNHAYDLVVPLAAIVSDDLRRLAEQDPKFLLTLDPEI